LRSFPSQAQAHGGRHGRGEAQAQLPQRHAA
jgi:hypothetical protein